MKQCLQCEKEVIGRTDKKFCTLYCKTEYHYNINKNREDNLFKKIDDQLKLNRRLLKNFNKSGKSTIRKEMLIDAGFNPKFFTQYWKSQIGDVYFFCYEFGFLERKENGKSKYILITWQDYMNE